MDAESRWWTIIACQSCGQRVHPDNTGHASYCQTPSLRNVEAVEVVPAKLLRDRVPCDDAAVERAIEAAMDAIVESTDVIANGDEPFPGWALKLAERAIAAGFRAAGGQDAH